MKLSHPVLSYKIMDQLSEFGVSVIYSAQEQKGLLPNMLRSLHPNTRLVGSAFTVLLPPGDNLMVHKAMEHIHAGDVLIIDCEDDHDTAVWGELLATQGLRVGLAGVIVNGAVKNADALIDMGLPVFTRAVSVKKPVQKIKGKMMCSLNFEGCHIKPGDVVIGDRDGIIIIERQNLDEVYTRSLLLYNENVTRKAKISYGMSAYDVIKQEIK